MKRSRGSVWETLFVVLGCCALLAILIVVRQQMGIPAENLIETSWLVIALIPVLVWLVASGRLIEFTAGSVSAKLAETSKEPALPRAFGESRVALFPSEGVQSGPMPELEKAALQDPVFLILELGCDWYADWAIKLWVERLLQSPSFQYVAFVSPNGRLGAYVSGNALLSALGAQPDAPNYVSIAECVRRRTVPPIVGVRTDWLSLETTNRQALAYLTAIKREDVAVVDQQGRLAGLLRRSDILDTFMTSFILEEQKPSSRTKEDR